MTESTTSRKETLPSETQQPDNTEPVRASTPLMLSAVEPLFTADDNQGIKEARDNIESEKVKSPSQQVLDSFLSSSRTEEDAIQLIEQLVAIDQNTGLHEDSLRNIDVFEHPEVKSYFSKPDIDQNTAGMYRFYLSFSHFHALQYKAIAPEQISNDEIQFHSTRAESEAGAAKKIIEALPASENTLETINSYTEWLDYTSATKAYLEGNLDKLRAIVQALPVDSTNYVVMEGLVEGLQQYKTPDYKRDYFDRMKRLLKK